MTKDFAKILDLKVSQKRVRELIAENLTSYVIKTTLEDDVEYLNVTIDFTLGGVVIDRRQEVLKMYVDIHDIEPLTEATSPETVFEKIEERILKEMPFLLRDTFVVSPDRLSVSRLLKKNKVRHLNSELDNAVMMSALEKDDAAEALKDYLEEYLEGTSYDSIEAIGTKEEPEPDEKPVVEILTESANCPICRGLLSYRVVRQMYYDMIGGCGP